MPGLRNQSCARVHINQNCVGTDTALGYGFRPPNDNNSVSGLLEYVRLAVWAVPLGDIYKVDKSEALCA